MPKRRAHGMGSITQRNDGRWEIRISLGVGPDGKRRIWRAYARTEGEATRLYRKAIAEHERGRLVASSNQTLAKYLDDWLPIHESSVSPKWAAECRRYVNQVLKPRLGRQRLDKLNVVVIQRLIADLQDEGAGASTIEKVRNVLRAALADAVEWQILAYNPAQHVEVPRKPRREAAIWNFDQVRQFMKAIEGDPDYALFVIAILTGARAGELCALTWSDVRWDEAGIILQRNVVRVPGQGLVVKETKSNSSRRFVALPPLGIRALRRQREQLDEWRRRLSRWEEHDLVFPAGPGRGRPGWYRHVEWPRRKLQDIAEKLGLPPLTFHDLRHLHGSLLLADGADLKVIQSRLGHSSIDVTGDIYLHLVNRQDREAADRLGARLEE